jgi:uncharacterized protein (TIGR02145 family)
MKIIFKFWIYPTIILGVLLSSCKESETNLNAPEFDSFTDPRNGKVYKTVKIGGQWIMAENLAYKPDQGNYWIYNNDSNNVAIYGYLYDWETAKNIAPEGWHLPTHEEWKIFRKTLGGKAFTISKNDHSFSLVYEKVIAGGSSGFNALFGGRCYQNGDFFRDLNEIGDYWSSTGSANRPYLFCVVKPNSFWGNKNGIGEIINHTNST